VVAARASDRRERREQRPHHLRKPLLLVHIIGSVGLLGAAAASVLMLALSVALSVYKPGGRLRRAARA
jgi:hypothetical protein